jgi:hypothetical protein
MTKLPLNVDDLMTRLKENSRTELDHMRRLAEAIRNADNQLLEEVRAVTLLHDVRREAIFGELQHLAGRLCVMPTRYVETEQRPALNHPQHRYEHPAQPVEDTDPVTLEPDPGSSAGDWRRATQRIDEEIDDFFDRTGARH